MITYQYKRNGFATILITLLIGFLALGGALTMSTGAFKSLIENKNTSLGDQALYTAESELNEGFYQSIGSVSYTSGPHIPLNNVTSGSITVTNLPSYQIKVKGIASNGQTE